MRAIRDFILFFVVVIIERIRLIFEIDDCGIFDDFVFFLCFFFFFFFFFSFFFYFISFVFFSFAWSSCFGLLVYVDFVIC